MLKLKNLDLLLESDFKEFIIKNKRGKQYFGASKILSYHNLNIGNATIVEYYHHLLNSTQSKSYAITAALLLRQKAQGLKLKGNYMSIITEKGKIRIDLTAPEVEENQEEMISLVVNAYKNERERFFHQQNQKTDLGLVFTGSTSFSFYKPLGDKTAKFELITSDKEKQFGMDEEKFFKETIRSIFTTYDEEISYDEYNATESMGYDMAFDLSYKLTVASVGKKMIILDHMDAKYNRILKHEINAHNRRIDIQGEKEYKKER